MFGGIQINVVDPGTVIECADEKLEVTDGQMVQKSGVYYVTQKQYDAIKERAAQ